MEQTIYGLICDYGDGSAGISWYRNKDKAYGLLDPYSPHWDESVSFINDGEPNSVLTFPADLDLEKCGFMFDDED